jgi:hypothetical protein
LIDCYLHHGYGWSREFMSNYGRSVLIPIYEIMNGREEADLLIGNGKRIYETQVTKSRNAPLLIEVARRLQRRVSKS